MEVNIGLLGAGDAAELGALLRAAPPTYISGFSPFAFEDAVIRDLLEKAQRDRYWGIRINGALAGFFMLRGLDEGYTRPSFGVFIAEPHAGHGLASLALAHVQAWCRCNGIETVMLKAADDNVAARHVYTRAGFIAVDVCRRTGHRVYEWRGNENKQ